MTAALRDRALSIGADPSDTAAERFRKRLLVGVALIILPVGFVWGCLRPDHAHALAGLALEMRECAKNCLPEGTEHDLRLRIGISSEPVVSGVIGRRVSSTTSGATR